MPEPALTQPPAEAIAQPGSLRRLLKNASLYGIGSAAASAIGIAIDPVLSYHLTRQDFGMLGLCASISGMLGATYTAGLDAAVGRQYYDVEHDEAARRRLVGTLNTFHVAWLLLLTGLQELLGPWLYDHFFPGMPYAPYGRLIMLALVLNAITAMPRALWTARENVTVLVRLRVAASLVSALLLYVLLVFGHLGPQSVLIAEVLTPFVLVFPYLRFGWGTFGFAWHPAVLGPALAYSIPMIVHLTSHWVLNAADRLVIERLLGRGDVGLYSVAYKATAALITVNLSINGAYVPQFMRAQRDPEQRAFVGQAVTWFLGVAALATLGLLCLGPTLLRAVYDPRFAEASGLVAILCTGALFQAGYLIGVNGLFFAQKTRLIPVLTVISGAANIGLCFWWIPPFGLIGAAWATTVSYAILALLVGLACRKATPIALQVGRLARIAGVFTAASLAASLVDGRLDVIPELAAKAAIAVCAPLLLVPLGFFTATERQWLRERVHGILRLLPGGPRP